MNRPTNPLIIVADLHMSRIWHCFGNYMHRVDLPTIQRMLASSLSNVLPINTHHLSETTKREGLMIGFGGVTFDQLAAVHPVDQMVIMLNINHQTSAEAAVAKARLAYSLTKERVVKLEVLNQDLKTSNNVALIDAVRMLKAELPQLIAMPLITNNYEDACTLLELGCPLLRVMGSGIGEGRGIVDTREFGRICELPVPVVLDGGVRNAGDYQIAHALGAEGCLVNSALFGGNSPPDVMLASFLECSQGFAHKVSAARTLA